MDVAEIKDIIGWILGLSATSIVTLIIGIISIARAGKLLPRELKAVDLDNRLKEADLALKMEGAADRAVEKSEKMRGRLEILEEKYCVLEDKIKEQDETIVRQSLRITAQELEISTLSCELENYKIYTSELISQIRQANVTPINMEDINLKDCSSDEVKKSFKKTKK